MIYTVLEISISSALVIAALLALSPFIDRHTAASGRCVLWLILTVRLLIPFNFTLPSPFVSITPQPRTVVMRSDSRMPVAVVTETERIERGNASPNSADYAPIITLEELLTVVWAAAAAAVLVRYLLSYWLFRRKIRGSLEEAGELGKVKIYRCPLIEGPMLAGFFKPVILLPNIEYTDEEREMVLRHEYVHYRRKDLWYKLLLVLAKSIHWFNPLVHFMARRADRDLEYSCDEAVTKGKDMEFKKLYAMTVLKAIRMEEGQ